MPSLIYLKDHSAQYVVIFLFLFFPFFLFLRADFKAIANENQRVKTTSERSSFSFRLK